MTALPACCGESSARRPPDASSKSYAPEIAPGSPPRASLLRGSPELSSGPASGPADNNPNRFFSARSSPARGKADRAPPNGAPTLGEAAHEWLQVLLPSPQALAHQKVSVHFQADSNSRPADFDVPRSGSSCAVWQLRSENPSLRASIPTRRIFHAGLRAHRGTLQMRPCA